jgi:hypothetical protein
VLSLPYVVAIIMKSSIYVRDANHTLLYNLPNKEPASIAEYELRREIVSGDMRKLRGYFELDTIT